LHLSREITLALLVLPLAGAGLSLVQVASRSEVFRRSPAQAKGQVVATQTAKRSLAALAPTLLSGLLLDLLPVQAVLGLIGSCLVFATLILALRPRQRPVAEPPEVPGPDPD
jgi:hypothetical protein